MPLTEYFFAGKKWRQRLGEMGQLPNRGGAREFLTGADSSDERANIRFSGYYQRQKSPKKIIFHLPTGDYSP